MAWPAVQGTNPAEPSQLMGSASPRQVAAVAGVASGQATHLVDWPSLSLPLRGATSTADTDVRPVVSVASVLAASVS